MTALDVSLNKNREPLLRLLDADATIEYFDYHQADNIPAHSHLHAHIPGRLHERRMRIEDEYGKPKRK